jgi:hypothetical protein
MRDPADVATGPAAHNRRYVKDRSPLFLSERKKHIKTPPSGQVENHWTIPKRQNIQGKGSVTLGRKVA